MLRKPMMEIIVYEEENEQDWYMESAKHEPQKAGYHQEINDKDQNRHSQNQLD